MSVSNLEAILVIVSSCLFKVFLDKIQLKCECAVGKYKCK